MSVPLSEIFDEFVDAKTRSGQTSNDNFLEIERYLKFQKSRGKKYLTYSSCLEFHLERKKTLSDYSLQESYHKLRHFSKWASLIDKNNEKLPKRRRRINGRRTPVIIDHNQVTEIIIGLRKTCVQRPLSAHAYSTLVGLLYVTGMRISEALINLSDEDVNLEEGYIYVQASKATRDRYILITESTSKMLANYRTAREIQFPGQRDRFFLIHTGAPKGAGSFRRLFARVTSELGYRSSSQKGRKASSLVPHDLRHSFATNMVSKFHDEGLDIKEELPKLSMVLGHQSIKETYWYLESIPDLLAIILNKGVNYA